MGISATISVNADQAARLAEAIEGLITYSENAGKRPHIRITYLTGLLKVFVVWDPKYWYEINNAGELKIMDRRAPKKAADLSPAGSEPSSSEDPQDPEWPNDLNLLADKMADTVLQALVDNGFLSVDQIAGSSIGDLMEVPGIGKATAPKILQAALATFEDPTPTDPPVEGSDD